MKTDLYLIDYKFAKKFRHKTGKMFKYEENLKNSNKLFVGKFSSLGMH